MVSKNDLTTGNIKEKLIAFALPFLAANFLQALYGATDLFVVGQFSGTSAISAVNIGSQIMQIITSFVIGCSMGSTVTLGQCIGSKDDRKSAKTLGSTIVLFFLFALVVTPLMIWLSPDIAVLMHTPPDALKEATDYVRICSIGIPFIIIFNVSAAILRGMGDSKTPMYIVAIACFVNIVGDLILTGILGMGVVGVAIATSAAQLISSICGIIMMMKHGVSFPFSRINITLTKNSSKAIMSVGLPIAMQDTLINVSFIVLTVIANGRGLIASSAVGIVEKLILFMFLVPSSMLSAISAITAQNIGAQKPERAKQAVKFGMFLTVSFGVLMCAISWIYPHLLTRIFSKEIDVILAANEYLKTYSFDCILVGFTFCLNGYLCGVGKSVVTFLHNVISIFLVRIPAAYFLCKLFPSTLMPMGLASPLGSMISIIILVIYFALIVKSEAAKANKSAEAWEYMKQQNEI